MGLRGPKRDPNSRRGRREAAVAALNAMQPGPVLVQPKQDSQPAAEIEAPSWLSEKAREHFASIVDRLRGAGVAVLPLYAEAIGIAAYRFTVAAEWVELGESKRGDLNLAGKLEVQKIVERNLRAAEAIVDRLCMTPKSAIQAGIKKEAPKKPGPIATLLAAKRGLDLSRS